MEDERPRGATMGDSVKIWCDQTESENMSYQSGWTIPPVCTNGRGGVTFFSSQRISQRAVRTSLEKQLEPIYL